MRRKYSDVASRIVLENYKSKGVKWIIAEFARLGEPERTRNSIQLHARTLKACRPANVHTTSVHIDDCIRRAYATGRVGAVGKCALAVNRPRGWVVERAAALGLKGIKSGRAKPLTEAMRHFIANHAHLTPAHISKRMRANFNRRVSPSRIGEYIKTHNITPKNDRPLTGAEVCEMIGFGTPKLRSVVMAGKLLAERTLEFGEKGGAPYWFEPVDIARFVISYPRDVDLRRVDQVWFIDLLATYATEATKEGRRDSLRRVAQVSRENPGLTHQQIAERHGLSDSAVSTGVIQEARRKLKEAA